MAKSRLSIIGIATAAVIAISIIIIVVLHYPNLVGSTSTYTATSSSTVYFTIVDNDYPSPDAGMNGSYYHSFATPWPVIHVQKGQTVVIHVVNEGDEPHGFMIGHYFDSGVALQPGASYTVTFLADEAGTFTFRCSIFCAIHVYMQNGELIVSS